MSEQKPQQGSFSLEDVLRIVKESTVAMAQEMKKPTPEQQAKIDEEKERQKKRVEASIAEANREKQRRDMEQMSCSHMKPHPYQGKTRIVAPLHGDGLHHPLCLFCRKEFKPFAPSNETIPIGMSLDDFNGITPQIIEHWGNRYEKEHAAVAR